MAEEYSTKTEAKELLNILADVSSLNNIDELHREHIGQLISSFSDCKAWTVHCPESQIFCACLVHVRKILSHHIDIILSILRETMANDVDPELRLKHFVLLSEYFNQESPNEVIDLKFVNEFLEGCILPGLIWTAGRAAEAIRTAAISCLCAFLESYGNDPLLEGAENFTEENMSLIFDKIIPILISLADDNSKKSRLYSLRAMYLIMGIRKRFHHLTEEYVHKLYPVLLKRLDDGCDDIRLASLEVLVKVWDAVPENYDLQFNKGHVDMLYTTAIIYLDDPDSQFQKFVLGNYDLN